jgi:hypothetical protein
MPAIGVLRALEASPPGRRVELSWCQAQGGSRVLPVHAARWSQWPDGVLTKDRMVTGDRPAVAGDSSPVYLPSGRADRAPEDVRTLLEADPGAPDTRCPECGAPLKGRKRACSAACRRAPLPPTSGCLDPPLGITGFPSTDRRSTRIVGPLCSQVPQGRDAPVFSRPRLDRWPGQYVNRASEVRRATAHLDRM